MNSSSISSHEKFNVFLKSLRASVFYPVTLNDNMSKTSHHCSLDMNLCCTEAGLKQQLLVCSVLRTLSLLHSGRVRLAKTLVWCEYCKLCRMRACEWASFTSCDLSGLNWSKGNPSSFKSRPIGPSEGHHQWQASSMWRLPPISRGTDDQ